MRRLLVFVLGLALVAAACGDGDGGGATAPSTAPDLGRRATVTIVAYDSFSVSEDVLAAFTDATGIRVEVLPAGDTGTMLNQLILTRGAPIGDVAWGIDNTLLSKALAEDLFVPYSSPVLAEVPDRFELDPQHRLVPVDHGDVCLNYDIDHFARTGIEVPETLADLADPRYSGLLSVQNPALSSPGLAFLLATVAEFGEDGWQQYWRDLVANDVSVQPSWDDSYYLDFTVGSGGVGDRPLVVSYASSPPAEVIFADPRPDTAPTGVIEATCFGQVEFAGILAGTGDLGAAQEVIDFLLSVDLQEDIPLNNFVFPVNENAALPPEFIEFAIVADQPLSLAPEVIEEHREEWVTRWFELVTG